MMDRFCASAGPMRHLFLIFGIRPLHGTSLPGRWSGGSTFVRDLVDIVMRRLHLCATRPDDAWQSACLWRFGVGMKGPGPAAPRPPLGDLLLSPRIGADELIAQDLPTPPIDRAIPELIRRARRATEVQVINGLIRGNLTRSFER